MSSLRFGISTCPNDTFAYHALLTNRIDTGDLDFEIELLDVEELNRRLLDGEFDVAKTSFAAALRLAGKVTVLRVGAALGFGVGPLLLGRAQGQPEDEINEGTITRPARVLCPGSNTTANLLYQLFHPGAGVVEQAVFSAIMPALETGKADFGVCIHEGRFTWKSRGLTAIEDLGETWEKATELPLPLGGLVARTHLDDALVRQVTTVLQASIDYAWANRDETLSTMRRYAQELDDDVILAHVDLYVNERTRDLGDEGARALEELSRRAVAAGLVPPGLPGLEIR